MKDRSELASGAPFGRKPPVELIIAYSVHFPSFYHAEDIVISVFLNGYADPSQFQSVPYHPFSKVAVAVISLVQVKAIFKENSSLIKTGGSDDS